MRSSLVHRGFLVFGLALGGAPGLAWSADPPDRASPLEVDPDAEEDPSIIRGQVQRPEVVVVIRRENLDRGFVLDMKESFLDRIKESLRQAPF